MNKRPVIYYQYDRRWGKSPYALPGEDTTIMRNGCAITCAAMLIATLRDRSVTPVETGKWSVEHGYKARGLGTWDTYFRPQLAVYGINCARLSYKSDHKKAMELVRQGYYLIAHIEPGEWYKAGHSVIVWWADDKIRINDPGTTELSMFNADPDTFFRQVSGYHWVDARSYNSNGQGPIEDERRALIGEILRSEMEARQHTSMSDLLLWDLTNAAKSGVLEIPEIERR